MNNYDKKIAVTASVLGAATIAIGAFGAHGLKKLVDAAAISTFETGVRYQMYHIIVLLFLSFLGNLPSGLKRSVFWLFIFGILLFSGSIYLLSLNSILPFDATKIGFVTPIGGLLFIVGWLRLGYGIFTLKSV
ncbi:DUF423 domain-containing protein [Aequorivita echinoideorum]|uniref:DUF423 domain-containing protein n=1 Tax=Aequorivita echinoideorum TaxID=1549647 RepID=A0ABS5S0Y1_9FLAO|nr:DUF423 domain-containing protein [Aequorivita echinoideorum]MBT0606866.1 DUF423 domain-containing protein [Aequorivita echinoideorum]